MFFLLVTKILQGNNKLLHGLKMQNVHKIIFIRKETNRKRFAFAWLHLLYFGIFASTSFSILINWCAINPVPLISIAFLKKWVWLCSFECCVGKCDSEKIDSEYNFSSSSTNHLIANLGNAFGVASDVASLQNFRACCFSYSMFSSSLKKLLLLMTRFGVLQTQIQKFQKNF